MKIVVKVGGSLLSGGVPETLLDDVRLLRGSNEIAIVHGGGEAVTKMATRLGKAQRFVVSPGGIKSRYTDAETAEIFSMVMSGELAAKLVLALDARGVKAVSLSGVDGALFRGKRKRWLVVIDERGRKVRIDGGYTGKVEAVNSSLVNGLMSDGYVPVISPVAIGEESELLNVDGDRAAGALAVAIAADVVVFATNVDGIVLDGKLVRRVTPDHLQGRLPEIGFGMQKKAMAAVESVRGGVKAGIMCSGVGDAPLERALARENCTVVE